MPGCAIYAAQMIPTTSRGPLSTSNMFSALRSGEPLAPQVSSRLADFCTIRMVDLSFVGPSALDPLPIPLEARVLYMSSSGRPELPWILCWTNRCGTRRRRASPLTPSEGGAQPQGCRSHSRRFPGGGPCLVARRPMDDARCGPLSRGLPEVSNRRKARVQAGSSRENYSMGQACPLPSLRPLPVEVEAGFAILIMERFVHGQRAGCPI
jgi:hypothetical protein